MSVRFVKDVHGRLLDATLDALWVQWRAIGGMTSAKSRARSTVDPEALVLCSLALADHERRLPEVVRDWMALNSNLLSVQRTKNLAPAFPPSVIRHLGALAGWALRAGKDARWKTLAANENDTDAGVFSGQRPVRRATAPDFHNPAAIMLRLRLGLGIGNKADVLTYLLSSAGSSATVREIAANTGYTVHALHRTVDDMTRAGFIQSTDGSPAEYHAGGEGWRKVLDTQLLARWCHWFELYAFTADFDNWMHDIRERTVSEYAFGVYARELMERYGKVFARAGARLPKVAEAPRRSADPIRQFVDANQRLTTWISANV